MKKKAFLLLALSTIMSGLFAEDITISDGENTLKINPAGFKISATDKRGKTMLKASEDFGLGINGSPVASAKQTKNFGGKKTIEVKTQDKETAQVEISMRDGVCEIIVFPANKDRENSVSLKFSGAEAAYGLGDAGGFNQTFNLISSEPKKFDIAINGGGKRWVSTFVIFPKNSAAAVFFDRGQRSVTLGKNIFEMSSKRIGATTFYLFFGDTGKIYANFKSVKEKCGFQDVTPKARLFEIGWESWDALGWNANQKTVKDTLSRYLAEGYKIKWAVVGSGFWDEGGTTTSFGRFGAKFPNPQEFRDWMKSSDIAWLIGLRTNLVPEGGPYFPKTKKRDRDLKVVSFYGNELSKDAKNKDILLKDSQGKPVLMTSHVFPIVPCYIIDGNKNGAGEWFAEQFKKWGVEGIKEDTMMPMMYETSVFNKPVRAIADGGAFVMARCGEFVSPGTLLRINDTRVADLAKRMPINYFQYAVCGAPNVYSDVSGVHNMKNLKETKSSLRQSWLIALTAGYAVGAYPDGWNEQDAQTYKKIALFHYSLVPYLYSAAVIGDLSGFPHTLTPLCIAYPEDENAYSEDEDFQWLIGNSILAAPALKTHAEGIRNIYLPKGVWFDFETGAKYEGGQTLQKQSVPVEKTPCFVGGKGIIILRNANTDTLSARIYNVGKKASEDFYTLKDGKKYSVKVSNPDIFSARVKDLSTGEFVEASKGVNYISFPVAEGNCYIVE